MARPGRLVRDDEGRGHRPAGRDRRPRRPRRARAPRLGPGGGDRTAVRRRSGSLEAVHAFVAEFSGPGMEEQRAGLFGPVVEVAADAPLLDQVLGMAGRRADWSPPTA